MYFLKIISVCFLIYGTSLPQEFLSELSNSETLFGNGTSIEELYKHENLLFTLVRNKTFYCVGIYSISDIKNPIELGRKDKNKYVGDDLFKDYVIYKKDSVLNLEFYAIKVPPGTGNFNHFFFKPNRYIVKDSLIFEIQGYNSVMRVFMIKTPDRIELISTYNFNINFGEVSGIQVSGDILYFSTRGSGVFLVDITDPLQPIEENIIKDKNIIGLLNADDRIIAGDDFSKILFYDVSKPREPILLKTLSYSHSTFHGTYNQDFNFIATGKNKVAVFNKNSIPVNTIDTYGSVNTILCDSDYLFPGTSIGIEIYHVPDSKTVDPEKVYGANLAFPVKLIKTGKLMYTINRGDGLIITDVSDSLHPVIRSRLDLNGCAISIVVSEKYAFIGDYIHGLQIIDISNPDNPTLVSTLEIEGNVCDIDLSDNKIFLLNDNNKLYIINVLTKIKPEIEFSETLINYSERYFGNYKKLKVTGDNIWICLFESPLMVFQYKNKLLNKINFSGENFNNYPHEIKLMDSLLFFVSLSGIQIIDPENFRTIISSFGKSLASGSSTISYDNLRNILYVVEVYSDGFDIVRYDLHNSANPLRINGYYQLGEWPELISPDIFIENNILYVLHQNGIKMFSTDKVSSRAYKNIPDIKFELFQNYPNPFNPTTKLGFRISARAGRSDSRHDGQVGFVTLKVYDILGNEIATLVNEEKPEGEYEVEFDGSKLSSGFYFYVLRTENYQLTRKMILMK